VIQALRARHARGYLVSMALTLGIGMGVTSVVFEAARTALIAPLPYADAGRLVHVSLRTPAWGRLLLSYPAYREWTAVARTCSAAAAYSRTNRTLTGAELPVRLAITQVSANFFATLGVPVSGGEFTPANERAGSDHVAIVTSRFAKRYLAAHANPIGATIQLGGVAYEVIGLLPPDFRFDIDTPDLFIPLGLTPLDETSRNSHWLGVIGRVRDGRDASAVAAEVGASLAAAGELGAAVEVVPLRTYIVGNLRPVLLALAVGALFVLVAAAASAANLASARLASRRREFAIRAALGASSGRLWRLTLHELSLVACAAMAASLTCAVVTMTILVRVIPSSLLARAPFLAPLRPATPLVAAALALPVIALAFALLAVTPDVRRGARASVRDVGGSGRGASKLTARRWLVAAQVTASAVLLVSAALLSRSVSRLVGEPIGFSTRNLAAVKLSVTGARYETDDAVARFYDQAAAAALSIRGVERAGVIDELPLTKDTGMVSAAPLPGRGTTGAPTMAVIRSAGPGYFETTGIAVRGGRSFAPTDSADRPPVVVVSRRLATSLFPDGDVVGRRISFGHRITYEVIGIVDDVRLGELDRPFAPVVYTSALQDPSRSAYLVWRSQLPLTSVLPALRARVASIDRDVPVYGAVTLSEARNATAGMVVRTSALFPIAVFGGLTLLVAATGVYGMLSYDLAQRTRELGIRVALGASARDIAGYALHQGLTPVVAGLVAGAALAAICSRAAAALLYAVGPFDLPAFAIAAGVMLAVALAACAAPTIRALRIDPVRALASE
jgi:putative ABC transport system permease protein